jgi:hypothetical protein
LILGRFLKELRGYIIFGKTYKNMYDYDNDNYNKKSEDSLKTKLLLFGILMIIIGIVKGLIWLYENLIN